jgi:acetyl-CoA carboxylase biotin carboxyl carrier protein
MTTSGPERNDHQLLETLRKQTQVLLQETAGPLRKVSVTSGEAAVTVEWAEPDEPVAQNGNGQAPEPAPDGAGPPANGRVAVTAPLVGTFYRRPEPGAEPFVEVGSLIDAGETVAIVEAMKLMNPVKAAEAGRVVAIHPGDGEMVEFGQPLMDLEPAAPEHPAG